MTTRSTTILFLLFFGMITALQAQDDAGKKDGNMGATPKDMWEFGFNAGHFFYAGEVDFQPGFAAGFHLRKSLDYVFSLRFDGLYGMAQGETEDIGRSFESTWLSGTAYGVLSFNSLRWDKPVRKTNFYVMLGGGGNLYETDYTFLVGNDRMPTTRTFEGKIAAHAAGGAGIAFRFGRRVNIALEHQAFVLFGNRSDLMDGFNRNVADELTPFRDIPNYTNLSINFNIGNPANRAEPLYWINPMEVVFDQIRGVQEETKMALQDSDGDGVIDAIDQDPNTPPDVPVDTKGRTLDSDRDGVPDYKDAEPYNVPRPGEIVNADGVIENPIDGRGSGVTEDRVKELIDEALQEYRLTEQGNAVAEWFLPMIHFGMDSYVIKYADYGTLAGIGRMMKGNDKMRLVVTGFTDQTGPESYNSQLSYQRARAVIEHLVNNHGIGRGRFVLEYKGQQDALVPSTSSYMNRRVEFRMAGPGDVEMDPPTPGNNSNKDGY